MKRKWHLPDDFWLVLGLVWVFGGLFSWMIADTIWAPCTPRVGCGLDSYHIGLPMMIYGLILIAPIGVVCVSALSFLTFSIGRGLWRNRPRRVWVPIHDDLRKVTPMAPVDEDWH